MTQSNRQVVTGLKDLTTIGGLIAVFSLLGQDYIKKIPETPAVIAMPTASAIAKAQPPIVR